MALELEPLCAPASNILPINAPAVRVGVIGYGYWGPNLVRNLAEVEGFRVTSVSDMSESRLALARARYPSITTTTDCHRLIDDPAVDAVVIMTPVSTHYPLALEALQAGKHVLVAKPITASSEHAVHLIEEAERRDLVLMVDHTFVYTDAVRRIKDLVDKGSLGRLYYYDSVRVNLGLFQHDVNVLWDLAVHDLSIMDYVLGESPCAVAATGAAHIPGKPVNTAYLTCFFENNVIAHHHVNWLAPVKLRRTLVCGDRQMIVYDDIEPSEKIKVYDRGVTLTNGPERVAETMIGYRSGDMWAPQISLTEGLKVEVQHFLSCIRERRQPLSDGEAGLRVVTLLEAATRSMWQRRSPAIWYPLQYLAFFAWALFVVSGLALRRRYDVVQVDNIPDLLVFSTLVPRLRRMPIVFFMYELMPEMTATRLSLGASDRGLRLVYALERAATRWADRIITVSDRLRRILAGRGVDPTRVSVVANSFAIGDLPPRVEPNRPVLILPSTLIERNGGQVAIRAVAELARDWPDLTLRILGGGEYRATLIALTNQLGLQKHVSFSDGFVPRSEAVREIRRSTLGLVPLLPDGYGHLMLPNKVFEFVFMDIPFVCSRLPAIEEHLPGDAVAYFEPGDAASLAGQIRRLLRDPQAARQQAARARRAMAELSWAHGSRRYLGALGVTAVADHPNERVSLTIRAAVEPGAS